MNKTLFKIVKIAVPVASIALQFASGWLADKKLDEKIVEKSTEVFTKLNKKG